MRLALESGPVLDLKEMRAEMTEFRDEVREGFSSLLARSTKQQAQIIATRTRQHRMTMLALLGVYIAILASVLIPLLTTGPA